jgi:hypothetical protein
MRIRASHLISMVTGATLCIAVSAPAGAQQSGVFAYPDKGQSVQQQQKDQMECHNWAVGQTGFDPTQARPPQGVAYQGQPYSSGGGGVFDYGSGETGQGGVVGDAARGAATGAVLGAIAGDAGKGAAWGAVGGTVFGGMKRSSRKAEEERWRQQQQAQAQQQLQAQQQQYQFAMQNYQRAWGACMTSRNYRVQ